MNHRSTDETMICAGTSLCCAAHAWLAENQRIPIEQRHERRVRIIRKIDVFNGASEWDYFDYAPTAGDVFLATHIGELVVCTDTDVVAHERATSTFQRWPSVGDAFVSCFREALGLHAIAGVNIANVDAGAATMNQRSRWN